MFIFDLNPLERKILIIISSIFLILFIYIIYLNFEIFNLKDNLNNKEKLYSLQISNRIEEIDGLTQQVEDMQKIINVGLSLDKNYEKAYSDTHFDNFNKYLFEVVPNGYPLKNIYVTSKYGSRFHPTLQEEKIHTGVDLRSAIGEYVYSTASGIVEKAINIDNGGYGKYIVVQHGFGFSTLYAHLDEVLVKEGDFISKNDLIAFSGNSGRSTGPHLHYEVRFLGLHKNPLDFIYWNKNTINSMKYNQNGVNWQKLYSIFKIRGNVNDK